MFDFLTFVSHTSEVDGTTHVLSVRLDSSGASPQASSTAVTVSKFNLRLETKNDQVARAAAANSNTAASGDNGNAAAAPTPADAAAAGKPAAAATPVVNPAASKGTKKVLLSHGGAVAQHTQKTD